MAHVARKHNNLELSRQSLSTVADVKMPLDDAFRQVREKVMLCVDTPHEGVTFINSTNLEYFTPQQKAELLRLKATFWYVI